MVAGPRLSYLRVNDEEANERVKEEVCYDYETCQAYRLVLCDNCRQDS